MRIGAAVMWQDRQRQFHIGEVVRVCTASLVARNGSQTKRLKQGQAHRLHGFDVEQKVASKRLANPYGRRDRMTQLGRVLTA